MGLMDVLFKPGSYHPKLIQKEPLNEPTTPMQTTKKHQSSERVKPIALPISFKEIEHVSKHLKNDGEYYYLFLCCYLFGLRVTEALNLKRGDFEIKEDVLNVKVNTLKNRRTPIRILPCYLYGKEQGMVQELIDHIVSIQDYSQKLFSVTRQRAYNHFTETIEYPVRAIDPRTRRFIDITFKVHPHYLRHCRLTHLVTEYNFDLMRLIQYAGWTNSNPATIYVSMDWSSLATPLMKNNNV